MGNFDRLRSGLVPPVPTPSGPAEPLDVLVVVNDLAPYGSQRVAVCLVEEWARSRSVVVATLEDPASDVLPLPDGVRRVALVRHRWKAWALVSLAWQLRRLVRRTRPQHVVSHMTFANTITLIALLGARRRPVVVEHSLLSRALPDQAGGRVSTVLLRRLLPGAAAVVAPSDAVVQDVRSVLEVPQEKMARIYNPVPHRSLPSASAPSLHPWLEESRALTTFVCVGAFRPAKGQTVLVDALALMRAQGDTTTRVILVGDGPGADEIRRQVHEGEVDDAVHLAGYRDDALAWIARADALVMPSRWETFGLVAVEAARCGVPVVATDVAGLREVVPARVPGWSVPPDDPAALAHLLSGLRRPVPPPAGASDLAEFEPAVVAERYWSLMESVAGR